MTNSPITPLSYTNKDFQTIYPELLELAKELSYKWDPTVSNESDPGVVLLKLNAIIADKNNYNIDKNILETFPSTVTQEVNARNLYKQLGYHMPWYMSANCNIAFKWISDASLPDEGITIPKYTMIIDDIDNCVYTTTQEALLLNSAKETSVSSVQGILVHYNLNGSTLITPTNLDLERRLYLNDYTVAENGVFVSSLPNDSSALQHWSRVDNLSVEPLGQYVYEFGIDVRNSKCYIEFPEDVFSLMGQGVYVDYVISSGELGRVSKNTLNTFYNEVSVYIDGKSTPLTSDNIKITNMSASTGGESPQSIEDAYKSYKKTVGTFNTLVTIRDYINYIYTNNMVSNGFVCDRFNDPQSSYKIITDDGLNPYIDYQKKNESEETFVKYQDNFSIEDLYVKSVSGGKIEFTPVNDVTGDTSNIYKKVAIDEMSAFDLKLYAFSYINPIETKEDYETSFSLLPSQSTANKTITSRLSNVKCVQHDFVDILKDEPCLFKNIFPIKVKVITHSTLSTSEQVQVKQNVLISLYKSLNSRNVEFGETPSYTEVYNTIMGSDDRIKFIILDDFTYTTLATVWTGNKFIDIPVSTNKSQFVIEASDTDRAVRKLRQNGIYDFSNYFVKVTEAIGGSTVSSLYYWDTSDGEWDRIDYSKCQNIQKSIIAKSVLAGKTPLFQPSGNFEIPMEHDILGEYTTDTISTNIAFVSGINLSTGSIESSAVGFPDSSAGSINWSNETTSNPHINTIELKDNEQIRFLSPSLVSSANYSTYVKCVLSLNSPTSYSGKVARNTDIKDMGTTGKLVFYPLKRDDGDYYFTESQQRLFASYWVSSANAIVQGAASYSKLDTPMLIEGGIVAFYKIEVNLSASTIFNTNEGAEPESGKIIRNDNDEMIAYTTAGASTVYGVPVTIITAENYVIEANSEFQLSNGEYIAFFWRDEQGKDAPFKYKIYRGTDINSVLNVESPIIKPSFRLEAVQGDSQNRTALAFINTLESEGSLLSGTNNFNTIYNLYGSYVLDSHRTVDMMSLNQVQFSAPDKYYFISKKINNNSTVREYVMDFKRSGEFVNNGVSSVLYSYTLENDEYFIRVNSLLSSMEIYTSGTMIGIVTPTSTNKEIELKATYVEASEFNSKGLDSIKNSMCSIQSSWTMVAREQNIYSFSNGDTVYIQNLSQFSSIADNGTIISDSRNSEGFPDRGLCICSWGDTYFQSADISYRTSSDNTRISLPNLKFNSSLLCWTARASLNVDMSSSNAQVFNSVVRDSVLTLQYVKIADFKRGYNDDDSFGVQTNYDFNSYGGTNIDATLLSIAGDTVPRTFLIYDYTSSTDIGSKEDDGSICVEFSYSDNELLSDNIISLTMDNVDFDALLCKVEIVSDKVEDILYYGERSSSTYSAILGTVSTGVPLHGVRYLLIPLISTGNSKVLELTTKRSTTSETISKIKFFPMTPVMMSRWNELVGIPDEDIINEVEMLDKDSIFNYTYKIPESVLISNPLESTSFFNSEHIMNSFTIGKALVGYGDTIVGNR